jgi:iron complex transport system ATP-binding protein
MSTSVYTIGDVCVSIAKSEILHSVSMTIESGSCTSIIGPNGAGKTTLLKCLNRILQPNAGEIRLNDQALESFSQKEIARQVAYVPQASGLVFAMTVRDFVMLGRYPHLSPFSAVSAEDRDAVDAAMKQAQIFEFRDRPLDTLSGGERQAAYIAAALAQGGKVLLMDEPTTYLDYGHQVDVLRLIRELRTEQRQTLILVTHDVNHAIQVSDHIVALKDGRVAFDGTPEALVSDDVLESIYETDFTRLNAEGQALPVIMPAEDAR